MADDSGLYAKIAEDVSESLEADSQGATAEPSTLLQKLKGAISKSVQSKVDSILQDVQRFSDHAKLYLYLQLPSGPSSGEKSLDLASLGSVEHMHACTWIRNHLEEYPDTCLPKQDVYDAYKRYCDNLCSRSLSAANFGKIIREIFPNIKARRLGGRGQSKYCYSGIRRKTVVNMPPLPSLDLKETETPERSDMVHSYNDEVMDAACALTCDWAEKILKRSFSSIVEVAQFLIQQHIISSRSAHADLVMAMAVSENAEPSREKRPPPSVKKSEPETPDGAAKTQPQAKTENAPKSAPVPPRGEPKRSTDSPAKGAASSPQVNALMARLPLLLPRVQVQPGDRLVVTPGVAAVHAPPSVLASKITPPPVAGTVKMALSVGPAPSALLAPVVNGPAGMVSQPSTVPVLNMMPVINVAVPPVTEIPLKPKGKPSAGGVNGCEAGRSPHDPQEAKAAQKRLAETPGEAMVKRKRGRPRKKPETSLPGKAQTEEGAKGAKEDSDIIVVKVGYDNQASGPPSPSWPDEETSDVEVVQVCEAKKPASKATGKEGSAVPSSLPAQGLPKPSVIPTQVSVIRGRTSSPPSLAKEKPGTSEECSRLVQGVPGSGAGAKPTLVRESDRAEGYRIPECDLQPTDLSMRKAASPSTKDPSVRASSMRLRRISAEQGKDAETVSRPPVTALQAPSR